MLKPPVPDTKLPTAPPTQQKKSETEQRFDVVKNLLQRAEKQIALALPKHITADRLIRIALTECRKVPKLLECDPHSFLGAIVQAAQMGFEPGSGLGHCYLIPFKKEVQLVFGYKGFIDLAYRSSRVGHISVREVRQGDTFSYRYGTAEEIVHEIEPDPKKRGELTHAYAIVFLQSGAKAFTVLSRAEVEEFRAFSAFPNSPAWKNHYGAMAKKTAVRQLLKYTPVSVEVQRAVALDEASDAGLLQNNGAAIPPITIDGIAIQDDKAEALRGHLDSGSVGQTLADSINQLPESERFGFEKDMV